MLCPYVIMKLKMSRGKLKHEWIFRHFYSENKNNKHNDNTFVLHAVKAHTNTI